MSNPHHLLAALVAVATLAGSTPARADIYCGPSDAWGTQQCVAGLRSDIADTIYAPQRQSQWCWAASISMVFRHHGLAISQEQLVAEAWGSIVDLPAGPYQILQSLNRVWVDGQGRRFRVSAEAFTVDPGTAAQDLSRDAPLIIGTHGHAMVLTALEYTRYADGSGTVTGATVRDPWPGRGQRALSTAEWQDTHFLARIEVTPLGGTVQSAARCRTVTEPCTHPAHPAGDLVPCEHLCATPWGFTACHPLGDLVPCTHPAHPGGHTQTHCH